MNKSQQKEITNKSYKGNPDLFIDNDQRKCFSITKYQNSLLSYTERNQTTEKMIFAKNNLTLTKVMSSMPRFKMEQLYQMKKTQIKNMLLQKTVNPNKSQKFINANGSHQQKPKPEIKLYEGLAKQNKKSKDNIDNVNQLSHTYYDNETSNENLSIFYDQSKMKIDRDQQSGVSASAASLLREIDNYRMKNQEEAFESVQSRIQTSQRKFNREKPKLIVLTDNSRKNMFKVKDKLQKIFDNQEETIEDKDIKEIFVKQNRTKNVFDFHPYFYNMYLSKNRGMQLKVSQNTNESSLKLQKNINSMIQQLEYQGNRYRTKTINQQTTI